MPTNTIPIAPRNSFLVGMLWYRNAVTGTITEVTSIYPVISHCTADVDTAISSAIVIRATLSIVSLNSATVALKTSTPIIIHGLIDFLLIYFSSRLIAQNFMYFITKKPTREMQISNY